MIFQFKNLPYAMDALEPHISVQTMKFHHDKHYKKYVATLNELIPKSKMTGDSLEEVVKHSHNVDTAIFQNAAQAWNHEFFWQCLSPAKTKASNVGANIIDDQFGSIHEFKEAFNKAALSLFGSGWVWVVRKTNNDLAVMPLEKADSPLVTGEIPLMVCDVWEHAYYLDCQNDRAKYLDEFWKIFNWKFFENNMQSSSVKMDSKSKREDDAIFIGI